jgi:MFS family permease
MAQTGNGKSGHLGDVMPVADEVARSAASGRVSTRWAPFAGVTYVLVVLLASSNLPTPLYPEYERVFGLSPLLITVVFAAYAVVVIPSVLVFGPLSDAIGRRRVFIPALVAAIVAMALFAAAQGAAWLFAAQVFEGLALGALQGTAAPALLETHPNSDQQRASTVASAATVGGAALGPILAGVLAQYGPAGRRLPYLVEIGLLVIALVTVMVALPADSQRQPYHPRRPSVPAEIRGGFATAAVSTFVAWAVTALFLALIPSFAQIITGSSNLVVTGGLVTALLAAAAAVQIVGQRWPSLPTQIGGLALLVVALLALIVTSHLTSVVLLVAAAVLAGCGLGLAFMGALRDVSELAPADRRGDVVASFYVATYIGTALPVIGVGLLADKAGLFTAVQIFGYAAIAVCLAGLTALTIQQHRRATGRL